MSWTVGKAWQKQGFAVADYMDNGFFGWKKWGRNYEVCCNSPIFLGEMMIFHALKMK